MKIGYFVTDFPYKNPHSGKEIHHSFYGGVGNVAYNLAIEMVKRGHKVYIFTSSIDSGDCVENYGDLIIYRYKTNFKIGDSPCSINLVYKPLFLNLNLDIIHVHAGNPPAPIAGYFYSKKYNIPLVVSYHADMMWNYGNLTRKSFVYFYNKFCLTSILGNATKIISPSKNYIDESLLLKDVERNICVIPNGVILRNFDIPLSKIECRAKLNIPVHMRIILFLGGLSPHKNPELLVNSMPTVLNEIPNSLLVFAGDGILRKKLEALSRNLGVEDNVRFVGFIEEELKPLYYKSSDIFCLPSIMEPFGIVNLEAMASGLPIVASSRGGFLDFVHDGKNGLLVSPYDVEEISKAVIYLLKCEDVRMKMGNIGKQIADNYSWNKISRETENLYLNLVM